MKEQLKTYLKKIVQIPYKAIFIIDIMALILTPYVLKNLPTTHPLSLAGYLLSAYALTVTIANEKRIIQHIKYLLEHDKLTLWRYFKKLMRKNKYTARYIESREFRAEISLYTGLAINLFYAFLKGMTGMYYQSAWLWSLGIYYFIFALIRFFLMRNVRVNSREHDKTATHSRQWRTYRNCGILMFLMNVTMTGLAVQMVWQNRANSYNRAIVILSAAYTFYSFITTFYGMLVFRKEKNAILSASKNLTFAGAVMSMYSLQTTMIMAFGSEDDAGFRMMMNATMGAVVMLAVLAIAISMIVKGNRQLRQIKL